jgi:hypothetical protein
MERVAVGSGDLGGGLLRRQTLGHARFLPPSCPRFGYVQLGPYPSRDASNGIVR